jgi:hypothetical protein
MLQKDVQAKEAKVAVHEADLQHFTYSQYAENIPMSFRQGRLNAIRSLCEDTGICSSAAENPLA